MEQDPNEIIWWEEELDLSALSYPQFLAFFFDRPIADGIKEAFDMFHEGIDRIVVSNPATVLGYVQEMCQGVVGIAKVYSSEQLDQGLWELLPESCVNCGSFLFDPTVDSEIRIDCVESMFIPFRDVVTRHQGDIYESIYWMWWDFILHGFHPSHKVEYGTLTRDQRLITDTVFKTLSRILALDHRGCQWCALHGFGHLYHPAMGDLVQRYLDEHRNELDAEDVRWIEGCRDNAVV